MKQSSRDSLRNSPPDLGDFLGGGGVTEGGGFRTLVRGTVFVCDGAVTPGPSRECDIAFFVKLRAKKNHTTNLEMAKSTRGAGGPNTGMQQAFPHNRNCLQLVLSEGLKTERNDRTRLVSPTASAKKMVFRSGKGDKIQRILGQKSSEKCANFPPFTLPLVVLDIFPPKKWSVFPVENSAKKCSASWQ